MADDRRTTPANQAEVGSRFDTGWWRAARLGGLLAVMAALAYAAGQYSVGRTSSATATAPIISPLRMWAMASVETRRPAAAGERNAFDAVAWCYECCSAVAASRVPT